MPTPLPLRPGDRIGIIAPASPPKKASALEAGLRYLENRGYVPETTRAFEPNGYLCGTDEERLAELNGFLRRPDVKALFCARGGFGTLRLLPDIDYVAAREHPTLVVGYSDITALHLALYRHAGLPGLSGPMVSVEWPSPDPHVERLFWDLAGGATPAPLVGPREEQLTPLRPGRSEGTLLGGNFAMITRLIGTPHLPDLQGTILFLEDVGEEPYRLDALFAQLALTGILSSLGGLVLGAFTDWEPSHDRPTLTPDEVIDHSTRDLSLPVARGLVYGHFPVKNTVPVGVRARLNVTDTKASLDILEPVVEPAA